MLVVLSVAYLFNVVDIATAAAVAAATFPAHPDGRSVL